MNKILVIKSNKIEDIKLLNKFDKDNNVVTSNESIKAKTIMSEKEYQELQRKSNEIKEKVAIETNGKISEICYISGVKDIKQCNLSFKDPINITKKMFNIGIDYAFNTLNMETIFININDDNQKLIKLLEENDFINLGEVKGKTTYLKEKNEKEIGSIKSEHNKKH